MKALTHIGNMSHPRRVLGGGLVWLLLVLLWLWFLSIGTEQVSSLRLAADSTSGMLVFLLIGVLAMILLLPGLFITITAGYLFGFTKGVILVLIAETVGATIAFALGSQVLRQPLLRYFDGHHPLLFSLNNGLRQRGGLVIFLTRLIPMFPFKLSNYYFGAARYRIGGFVIGTLLGILPITALNVTLGVAGAQLGGQVPSVSTQPAWLFVSAALAFAGLIVIVSRQAWKSLDELKQENASLSHSNPPARGHNHA